MREILFLNQGLKDKETGDQVSCPVATTPDEFSWCSSNCAWFRVTREPGERATAFCKETIIGVGGKIKENT